MMMMMMMMLMGYMILPIKFDQMLICCGPGLKCGICSLMTNQRTCLVFLFRYS